LPSALCTDATTSYKHSRRGTLRALLFACAPTSAMYRRRFLRASPTRQCLVDGAFRTNSVCASNLGMLRLQAWFRARPLRSSATHWREWRPRILRASTQSKAGIRSLLLEYCYQETLTSPGSGNSAERSTRKPPHAGDAPSGPVAQAFALARCLHERIDVR
jgi:hypothetical protein